MRELTDEMTNGQTDMYLITSKFNKHANDFVLIINNIFFKYSKIKKKTICF